MRQYNHLIVKRFIDKLYQSKEGKIELKKQDDCVIETVREGQNKGFFKSDSHGIVSEPK